MLYILMHRNREVAVLEISEQGPLIKIGKTLNREFLPMQDRIC